MSTKASLEAAPVQYTVRGIAPAVDRLLRATARQRGQSLNQVILEILSAATMGAPQRADFSGLVGRWEPDPEGESVLAAQRAIDEALWR